jgi:CMP-N-acetylneuraminic acid synthetase
MFGLIPIFTAHHPLKHSSEWHHILVKTAQEVLNCSVIKKALVCTDDPWIEQKLLNKNIEIACMTCIKCEREDTLVPPGLSEALEALLQRNPELDSPVAVVDCRNPVAGSHVMMTRMVNQFEKTEKEVLISVSEVVDNPCQLLTYYDIMHTACIHFMDTDTAKKGFCLSRPFFFDWQARGVYSEIGKYFSFKHAFSGFEPTVVSNNAVAKGEDPLLIMTSLNEARLVLRHKRVGESHLPDEASVERLNGEDHYILRLPQRYRQMAGLVKIVPFDSDRALWDYQVSLKVHDLAGPTPFILEPENASGVVCFAAALVEEGTYNHFDFFPTIPGFLDFEGGRAINLQRKEQIWGRQNFPPIYAANKTYTVGRPSALSDLESIVNGSRSEMFLMDRSQVLTIQTDLDLLYYHSLQKKEPLQPLKTTRSTTDRPPVRTCPKKPFSPEITSIGINEKDPDLQEHLISLLSDILVRDSKTDVPSTSNIMFWRAFINSQGSKNRALRHHRIDSLLTKAEVRLSCGDILVALQMLEQVLRHRPDHLGARQILQRLANGNLTDGEIDHTML